MVMNIFEEYEELQQQMLRNELLSTSVEYKMTDEFYKSHVLGVFDDNQHEFLVGGRRCNRMSMMRPEYEDENEIHFLFNSEKWNGTAVKDMTSSHIINTLLMLNRKASEFKLKYELFVIDNSGNGLLVPRDNIDDLAKMCPIDWMTSTPIYLALIGELDNRKLLNYYNTVQERLANEAK